MRPVWLDALAVKVGALTNIVDFRRYDQALRRRAIGNAPLFGLCSSARQLGQEVSDLRPEFGPMGSLGGNVAQHAGAVNEGGANAFKPGEHPFPVSLDITCELAQEVQMADPSHLFISPVGLEKSGTQPPVDVAGAGWHQPRFQQRLSSSTSCWKRARSLSLARPRMSRRIASNSAAWPGSALLLRLSQAVEALLPAM